MVDGVPRGHGMLTLGQYRISDVFKTVPDVDIYYSFRDVPPIFGKHQIASLSSDN